MFAFSQDRGYTKQQVCPIFRGGILPALKSFECLFHGEIGKLLRGLLEATNRLRTICWIETIKFRRREKAFAANYQRVLSTEFALYLFNRSTHLSCVHFFREISQRFITKFCRHIRLQ